MLTKSSVNNKPTSEHLNAEELTVLIYKRTFGRTRQENRFVLPWLHSQLREELDRDRVSKQTNPN